MMGELKDGWLNDLIWNADEAITKATNVIDKGMEAYQKGSTAFENIKELTSSGGSSGGSGSSYDNLADYSYQPANNQNTPPAAQGGINFNHILLGLGIMGTGYYLYKKNQNAA